MRTQLRQGTAIGTVMATLGGAILAVAAALGSSGAAGAAAPDGYHALTPARVLDTRVGTGHSSPVGPDTAIRLDVTGVGGVPEDGVGAVALNVTATEATEASFITVWPSDEQRPVASNLNSGPGGSTTNAVIATVADDGTVSLYNYAGTVHLLADVSGWLPVGSGYSALNPQRILDTRSGLGGSGPVSAGQSLKLTVAGQGGVPSTGVAAIVANVTATNVTERTFVTVWPGNVAQPMASNLNPEPGESTPNLVIATVAPDGSINLGNFAGALDLVVDVSGWFSHGANYQALTPARVLDTRAGVGRPAGAVGDGQSITVDITGVGGVPDGLTGAVVLNLTATEATEPTFVTAWPGDQPRPFTSSLNPEPGRDRPNLVTATLAADGSINLYNDSGSVHLIADVLGYLPESDTGSIEGGVFHTCAVDSSGMVRCWGYNGFGQLGNNSTTDSATPVVVPTLGDVVAVSAGEYHSCALIEDGTVRCWGYNETGQLGNSGTAPSPVPVAVPGVSGAIGLSAGDYHTCAVLSDGTVRCWGYNAFGQVGDGSTTDALTPRAVTGLTGVTDIAAGGYHTCAVLIDRTARCWGDGGGGQLGNGGTAVWPVPAEVSGLTDVDVLSAGSYHTCAVSAGTARCWGFNVFGQLGTGTTTDSATPVAVIGMSDVWGVTAGEYHTCAVLVDETAQCWGNNESGQLGDGSTTDRATPGPVTGLTDVVDLSAGADHTSAVTARLLCWGDNGTGQVGDGSTTNRPVPTPVVGT